MALGHLGMQEILKEYDRLQLQNREEMARRRTEVNRLAPAYFDYHNRIISLCMQHTKDTLYAEHAPDAFTDYQKELADLRSAKTKALLDAGLPADYMEPVYRCSKCKDTGFLEAAQCDCLKQRIIKSLYAQSGIEHLLATDNFDNLSYEYYEGADLEAFKAAVETARDLIAHFPYEKENLLLYGTVGCGKSFLSGCIAKELMDRGESVVYFSASALFDVLYQNTLYNEREALYNYELVIIDDLGAEMTNSFVTTALFSFLNERILRKKSTIISTNLSLADMKDRYSDRIVSRIIQNFKLCKLSGPDIRIRKRLSSRK